MAKSGSFNTSAKTQDLGKLYLTFAWSIKSQDPATNKTVINWSLKGAGTTGDYYYKAGNFKVVINGATVYSSSARIELYAGTTVASGTATITHASDGTKTFSASAEAGIYDYAVNCTGSGSWALDAIPRYPSVTHSLNNKTETSIVMNWSSDSTIDYLWYSKDGGDIWTGVDVTDGKNGTYTISGLSANKAYDIKTRLRRKDSQLYKDSGTLTVTTYGWPYCTEAPDFVVGNKVTLKLYNPLGRSCSVAVRGNGQLIHTWTGVTGTACAGLNDTTAVTNLYNSIPETINGEYSVTVTYDTHTNSSASGWYEINVDESMPAFTTFAYYDANATVSAVTGSNQVLVQGLSAVSVKIPSANKMVARNGATPYRYSAAFDMLAKEIPYTDGDIDVSLGVAGSYGTGRVVVRATDSRGVFTRVYKDVTILKYEKPVVYITATRKNNFENETTLAVTGTYTLLAVNGVNKNAVQSVKYRYREKGGTWPTSYTALTVTASGGKFTCSKVVLDLDNSKAYEFEVFADDKFGSLGTTIEHSAVDVGKPVLMVSSNKKLCYMNGNEIALREDVPTLVRFTNIPNNTDLNTIRTIGTYKSQSKGNTDTMTNVPKISGGFKLIVSNWTGGEGYSTLLRQDLYFCDRRYTRYEQNSSGNWSAWKQVGLLENIYPVGSVYITSANTNPATTLGVGTWTLIDKGFASAYCKTGSPDEVYFTAAENCNDEGTQFTRGDHSIRIRQAVSMDLAMEDATSMVLGYFDWDNIGVTNIATSIVEHLAYADGANGGIVYNVTYDTGEVKQVDTFDLAQIPSDKTFYLDFTIVVDKSRMVDQYCDKFYWKRTS